MHPRFLCLPEKFWREDSRRRFAFAISSDGIGVSVSVEVEVGRGMWRRIRTAAVDRARAEGVGGGLQVGDIVVGVDPGKVNLLSAMGFRVAALDGPEGPVLERIGRPVVLTAKLYKSLIGAGKFEVLVAAAQDGAMAMGGLGEVHAEYLRRWESRVPSLRRDFAAASVLEVLQYLSLGLPPEGGIAPPEAGAPVPWLALWGAFAFGARRRQLRWKAGVQRQHARDVILREFIRSFEGFPAVGALDDVVSLLVFTGLISRCRNANPSGRASSAGCDARSSA